MKRFAIIVIALVLVVAAVAFAANNIKKGSTIAFVRSGDIWLMESDGSNQRPFVAGIANARGRLHWSPDNKKLVFARSGQVMKKFPDGGGGQYLLTDLFYAYADSSNNWWEGITETMGAQGGEFARDGSKIIFVRDMNANTVNASGPKWQLSWYDTKSYLLRGVDMDSKTELMMSSPTLSPDAKQVAFVVARFIEQQFTTIGVATALFSEFPLKDEVLTERAKKLSGAVVPSWSPDGNWIAYLSNDMNNPGLYVVKPDMTGQRKVYTPPTGLQLNRNVPSWSPDSKMLLISTANGSIYKVSLAGGEAVRLSGPGSDSDPAWCN